MVFYRITIGAAIMTCSGDLTLRPTYGTIAAAADSTIVISVLVYDCCELFELFGGLCEKQ